MRQPASVRRVLRLTGALALVAACGVAHPLTQPAAMPAPDEIAASVLLIGDAGNPNPAGEPVLRALSREAAREPSRTTIVFLGDNVYPRGIPDSAAPTRAEAERRLRDQLAVVRESGTRGIFVPGNHDWAKQGQGGWDAVRRQGALIAADDGPSIMAPASGCPGPVVTDVGATVRIISLDTQWWVHGGPKPGPIDGTCTPNSADGIVDSVRGALAAAGGRNVLVTGHHPMASGGVHGGHFTWKDHIFPLRAVAKWLWIPLPIVGSIYPTARRSGISSQDMSGSANKRMRAAFESAFDTHPPLIYASGHDHGLQVLTGESARYILVSGAGIYHHESPVAWLPNTRFASADAGFMRLDVLADGRARLGVIEVDRTGKADERFSMWLE